MSAAVAALSPEAWAFSGVCVTAFFAFLTALVVRDGNKTRAQNTSQHGEGRVRIEELTSKIDGLSATVSVAASSSAQAASAALHAVEAVGEMRQDLGDIKERLTAVEEVQA